MCVVMHSILRSTSIPQKCIFVIQFDIHSSQMLIESYLTYNLSPFSLFVTMVEIQLVKTYQFLTHFIHPEKNVSLLPEAD